MAFRQIVGHRTALELAARALVRGSLPPSLFVRRSRWCWKGACCSGHCPSNELFEPAYGFLDPTPLQ